LPSRRLGSVGRPGDNLLCEKSDRFGEHDEEGEDMSSKGVGVARPVSVFVRALSEDEAVKLRRISRQSKVFALRQRAQILLASDSRSSAGEIARVLQTDENEVRRVIRDFNEHGMDSLRPPSGAGARGGSTTRPVSLQGAPAPDPPTARYHRPADAHLEVEQRPAL
jgi:hypothetical protein